MARILIEGGYIVSIGVRDHVIEDGIVAIVDDRIHYIGERSNFDASASNAEKTIPAKDRAVLPRLINTHIHLIGAHLKGVTEDKQGRAGSGLTDLRGMPRPGRRQLGLARARS